MQYIVVFNLFSIPVAKGFTSLSQAIHYFDQAQADPDLLPLGIYDVAAAEVISSELPNYYPEEQNNALVIATAQSYIERTD
jgi:hypothetical protein